MQRKLLTLLIVILFFLTGCQEEPQQIITIPPQPAKNTSSLVLNNTAKAEAPIEVAQEELKDEQEQEKELEKGQQQGQKDADNQEKQPPAAPVLEDFQGTPKLSLFPRVGDFQPEPDSDRHPYWRTFIDHLVKVTGVAENQADGSRGWVFRSVNSIDSLGYFSPLSVKPDQVYQVSFTLSGELPEGASAGIGVLEFDEFLWVGEQYTEEIHKKHFRGVHEGRRVTGKPSGIQQFAFKTGPETNMIHLVLFREGTHDRNSIMFDNISIK